MNSPISMYGWITVGDPVITRDEPKKIKFILSNTSKSVTSDRINVYLYNREGMYGASAE